MAATLVCLLPFLLLAARSASGQALSPGGPVDFGSTPVGNTSTDITLTFTANTTTTVTAIAAVTDGALNQDFSVTGQSCLGALAPPASCLITLHFKPSQIGLRRGELLITDGTGAFANRVPLHGVGLAAQVVFSPATAMALTALPALSPSTLSPSAALHDGAGDLYVLDIANDRLLEQTPDQTITGDFTVAATIPSLSSFSSIAIAGDGTLFVSSPNTGVVYAIAPGGVPAPLTTSVVLERPAGLATDGYGYLYIADNGTNRLLRVALDGSGTAAFALSNLVKSLSGPAGLAIDTNRNLYVADRGNNRVVRVSLNTGNAVSVSLSGLTLAAPQAVVVDAAGTLTIADSGNHRLVILPTSGAAVPLPITGTSPLASPSGVLLQPNGDLLVSDTDAGLVSLSRSAASLTFPTSTKVGTADATDGELQISLQNTGSYALDLGSSNGPSLSTGAFGVAGDSTCPLVPATSATISPFAQGSTCTYSVNFKPTTKGTNSATLALGFTGIGSTSPSGRVSPSADLSGTGFTVLESFSLVANPVTTTLGAPVSIIVTALNNDGSVAADYTGTANFTSTDPLATLPGGAITYTFTPADGGVHTFPAIGGQGVAFDSVGTFTVSARDTLEPTVTGTSNPVLVVNNSAVTLQSSVNPTLAGGTTILTATVAATVGAPTGSITFLDGTTVLGTGALTGGRATFTATFATAGSHTLTASYAGDASFLPATSAPFTQTVENFTLAVASGGSAAATIVNKGAAGYDLLISPLGGLTLAGPVALSVAGLPAGFSGTFAPASVASGAGTTAVKLTVSGGRAVAFDPQVQVSPGRLAPLAFALLLLPAGCMRRRARPVLRLLLLLVLAGGACTGLSGCLSDTTAGYYGTVPVTQTLTVTATSGSLLHTLTLSLTTQ